jgi:hypothetical protein
MSRLFDESSTEYLEIDQSIIPSAPWAMACLYYKINNTNEDTFMWTGDKDADTNRHMLYTSAANNNLKFNSYNGVDVGQAECSSGSFGVWRHGCAILVSDTDRRVLMDGAYKGTNATSVAVSNIDRTSIGRYGHATPSGYLDGYIAEAAIWDLSGWPGATASDKADSFETVLPSMAQYLVGGVTPLYYPLGLVAYWPLVSTLNDYVGGYNLTASGTVESIHPGVFRSGPQIIPPGSAAVGGTGRAMTTNTRYW